MSTRIKELWSLERGDRIHLQGRIVEIVGVYRDVFVTGEWKVEFVEVPRPYATARELDQQPVLRLGFKSANTRFVLAIANDPGATADGES